MNAVHGVQCNCLIDNDTGRIACPTSFSNPVNFGSTWNDSLAIDMGAVVGLETRALWLGGSHEYNGSPPPHIGLDAWSPNINIARDPRWGRNQEVASEDPLVNGRFGAGYTLGLQGNSSGLDSRYYQTIVTLKHWDAYSLEDSDGYTRYNFDANVSAFALADTYWPAFKAAVTTGGAKGVMCSYNAVNGVPTCASSSLTTVLRGQWGFDGYITSDSGAVESIYQQHKYVLDPVNASCVAIRDGTTDVCSGQVYYTSLLNATTMPSSPCNRTHLNAALYRTFKLRFQLGLFDPADESHPYWNVPLSQVNTTAAQDLNWLAVKSSMVLLKHDNVTLPFKLGQKVAVIGPHADDTSVLVGNYLGQMCPIESHIGNTSCLKSVFAAISDVNNANGGATTWIKGVPNVTSPDQSGIPAAVALAAAADVVVLVVGNDETVEAEMLDRKSIDLPGSQHQLIAAVAAVGKPTVVVILSGSCVDVSAELSSSAVGAIVYAGYPGTKGGEAVSATIYGQNDHLGGKVATTWYPSAYANQINMSLMEVDQGVGRSYRYYNGPVVFPFGYGLALTTFDIEPLGDGPTPAQASSTLHTSQASLAGPAGTSIKPSHQPVLSYSLNVTNTGNVAGDEVVQAYLQPLDKSTRLIRQLFDYQRVHLNPGQWATVTFDVSADTLVLVDRATGDRVSTPGSFNIEITNGNRVIAVHAVAVSGERVVVEAFPKLA